MRIPWLWLAVGVGGFALLASRRATAAPGRQPSFIEEGTASFYGPGFNGKETANQEIFDQNAMTAAHRTLPFDTQVLVTDLDTGRQIVVRINDRGPFVKKNGVIDTSRVIDLSQGAAERLGIVQKGLAHVSLERV